MPDREQLEEAARRLDAAAIAVADDEDAERLAGFADRLSGFVEDDRTPDHGRLARILHVLDEIEADADADAAAAIDRTREAITTYREGVEGV